MKNTAAKNVDEYLEVLPKNVRTTLEKLRKAIKSAAPDAEEKIGYRIPFYRQNGHLIAFSAFENHCSLITMSNAVIKKFKNKLGKYNISGTTIHFTHDNPLPSSLMKEIVTARIKENEKNKK